MVVEKIYFRKYCLNYVIEYKVEKHTQISTLFEQGNLHIITIDKISSEVRKCVYFSPKHLSWAVNIQSAQISTEGDCRVDVLMMKGKNIKFNTNLNFNT